MFHLFVFRSGRTERHTLQLNLQLSRMCVSSRRLTSPFMSPSLFRSLYSTRWLIARPASSSRVFGCLLISASVRVGFYARRITTRLWYRHLCRPAQRLERNLFKVAIYLLHFCLLHYLFFFSSIFIIYDEAGGLYRTNVDRIPADVCT